MQATRVLLMVALILVIGAGVNAEDKTIYITNLSSTTMPSIEMGNKPLEKVLDELHAKVPDFHYVVFRSPDAALDYPMLPAMKLENVNVDQFLTLLGDEFPGVIIKYNVNESRELVAPPLIEVNIRPDPSGVQAAAKSPSDSLSVRVFGLNDLIVERMTIYADKKPTEKQTTDDILSLVMAAQEQMDSRHLPSIKIHQPTNTLIFKGTADQAALLEQSLANLHPTSEDNQRMASNQNHLVSEYAEMEKENEQLKEQIRVFKAAATQPKK